MSKDYRMKTIRLGGFPGGERNLLINNDATSMISPPTDADSWLGAPQRRAEIERTAAAKYEREVVNQTGVTLVCFFAGNFSLCARFLPLVEEVSRSWNPPLNFVAIDVNQNEPLATLQHVWNVPHLQLYRDGEELCRHDGVLSRTALRQWIGSALGVTVHETESRSWWKFW